MSVQDKECLKGAGYLWSTDGFLMLPFDHELEKFQLKKIYYFIALSLFVLSLFFPSAFMNPSVLGRKV